MSTNGTAAAEQSAPATPLAPGDLIFVYNGPGLVTRLEGWALSVIEMMFGDGPEATRKRRVAVYRNADGDLDISAHVSPLAAVESAWHLVSPADAIVGGGPCGDGPSLTSEELEALRDSGKYKFLKGSVPFYGIPDTVECSPSAETGWVQEIRSEAVFHGARGGMYRWYEPDADQLATLSEPAAATDTPARPVADGPYAEALAAARKTGVRHADDAGLMALFCADSLQHLVGAVSPQLVWEGAQRAGLSTADLARLCAKDFMAVHELQWTTD
ncbi:hypothetical protein [Streptomyces phaeoluteigriseus]